MYDWLVLCYFKDWVYWKTVSNSRDLFSGSYCHIYIYIARVDVIYERVSHMIISIFVDGMSVKRVSNFVGNTSLENYWDLINCLQASAMQTWFS